VAVAHLMAAAFQHAGIAAEALDGTTPVDERRARLRRLKSGETRVLANCGVLTEGFDEPSVDCIIIARPTKSATLFTQMVGRGTRIYPGKEDCLVIDLIGVSGRHELMSVASLTGLPLDALKNGRSVADAVAEQEELQLREQRHGEVVAKTVELFRRRPLHWLTSGRSFVLSLGNFGWLLLNADPASAEEQWTTTVIDPMGQAQELASGLSLAYAQGVAEDYAREMGAGGLINPKAQWRQKPVTEYPKMEWLLGKLHIPHRPDVTAGEASDLISVAKLHQVYARSQDYAA
jgi:ATP-dependent helicase IRC3